MPILFCRGKLSMFFVKFELRVACIEHKKGSSFELPAFTCEYALS